VAFYVHRVWHLLLLGCAVFCCSWVLWYFIVSGARLNYTCVLFLRCFSGRCLDYSNDKIFNANDCIRIVMPTFLGVTVTDVSTNLLINIKYKAVKDSIPWSSFSGRRKILNVKEKDKHSNCYAQVSLAGIKY